MVAPETARSHSSRASATVGGVPLKGVASAMLSAFLALSGGHSFAANLAGSTGSAGTAGTLGTIGTAGSNGTSGSPNGTSGTNGTAATTGTGGASAVAGMTSANNDTVSSGGTVAGGVGGSGRAGGNGANGGSGYNTPPGTGGNGGSGGAGSNGSAGGAGLSGTDFHMVTAGSIFGGAGGVGGNGGNAGLAGSVSYGFYNPGDRVGTGVTGARGGTGGNGGFGGAGGTAVTGTGFFLTNSGLVRGGAGGVGGNGTTGRAGSRGGYGAAQGGTGGDGGSGGIAATGGAGGAGASGSGLTVINNSPGQILGGGGGAGGAGGTAGNGGAGGGVYSGTNGYSGTAGTSRSGGTGGAGGNGIASGTGSSVTNGGSVKGGAGGIGGLAGGGVSGGAGGAGGVGLTGTTLTLSNVVGGMIAGGNGGNGTAGASTNTGGAGGAGAAAVSGSAITLTNAGTLTGSNGGNGGSGRTGGAGGLGGSTLTGSSISLTNTGTITGGNGGNGGSGTLTNGAAGAGGAAINSTGGSTILNAGTIIAGRASQGTGAFGNAISFSGGGNQLVIQSGSVITGNVVSAGGDTLSLGGSVDSSFALALLGASAQYRGFTQYSKQDASTWSLTGTGGTSGDAWTVSGGTLALVNSAALTGNVAIGSGAELNGGSATITGALTNNGLLSIGSSSVPATILNVTGSFTQTAGGIFRISLADATSNYGKLNVTGNVTLSAGTGIDVNVIGSPTLAINERVTDVIKAGGSLSSGAITVTDNSYLFNFKTDTSRDPKAVDLIVVSAATPTTHSVTAATSISGNTPGAGAAGVLDQLIASGTSDPGMQAVITRLGQLQTTQQVSDAVRQTLPFQPGAGAIATNNALHSMNRIIQSRMGSNSGLSSGDEFLGDNVFWAKPFHTKGSQNDRNGVTGFQSKTNGIAVGLDLPVLNNWRVGGVFTYADSNVQNNSSAPAAQSTDVDTFQLGAYASYNVDSTTDINLQFDVGQNKNKGQRNIPFMGVIASSNYDSLAMHVSVGASRFFSVSDTTSITTSLRLDATRVQTNGYTETGAGALNLAVNKQTYKETLLAFDTKATHDLSNGVQIFGNFAVAYDFDNKQAASASAFVGGGSVFVTQGLNQTPWLTRLGLGVMKTDTNGTQYQARYDAEYRTSGYLNQTVSAQVRVPF